MPPAAFTVFDTAIGGCALAWSEAGLTGVWLPARDEQALRGHVRRRQPGAQESAPPPAVQQAARRIAALLQGAGDDLRDLVLDYAHVPSFHRRVYEFARGIGPGHTLTYGEVARALGAPDAARAVGQALGRNPFAIVVPCHRVLAAGGKAGGFSAPGGVSTKFRLLQIEGGLPQEQPRLF